MRWNRLVIQNKIKMSLYCYNFNETKCKVLILFQLLHLKYNYVFIFLLKALHTRALYSYFFAITNYCSSWFSVVSDQRLYARIKSFCAYAFTFLRLKLVSHTQAYSGVFAETSVLSGEEGRNFWWTCYMSL
jgi:hypothetical protein